MKLPAFYPILDTTVALARGLDPLDCAEQILSSGAQILQFRHKAFLSRQALAWLDAIANLTAKYNAMLVVNDRADLAKMFNAALHLGQDDLPPTAARRVVDTNTIIGFSTHNEAQLRAAATEPVDYVALGPIFGTSSKENPDAVVGVEELRRIRLLTNRPLVAIGGISRANALTVRDAGADSLAVVADLFPEDGQLTARTEQWLTLLG